MPDVEFPTAAGSVPGYLAEPAAGHGLATIVLQEWWGLEEHIRSGPRPGAAPRTFDQVLAPVWEGWRQTGMTEEAIDAMFQSVAGSNKGQALKDAIHGYLVSALAAHKVAVNGDSGWTPDSVGSGIAQIASAGAGSL